MTNAFKTVSSILPDSEMWWHNRNSVHQQACPPPPPWDVWNDVQLPCSPSIVCAAVTERIGFGAAVTMWSLPGMDAAACLSGCPRDLAVRPWEPHSRRGEKSGSTAVTLMKNLGRCSRRYCWKSMKNRAQAAFRASPSCLQERNPLK